MYAVIKTGGKQYRVVSGEKLKIEQIPAEVGAEITLDQVLMVGEGETVQVGTPTVSGATVKVTVLSQGRHDKIRIFKMRRRKHSRSIRGIVRITPKFALTPLPMAIQPDLRGADSWHTRKQAAVT
jgi:large subunit ribosomal protein L21